MSKDALNLEKLSQMLDRGAVGIISGSLLMLLPLLLRELIGTLLILFGSGSLLLALLLSLLREPSSALSLIGRTFNMLEDSPSHPTTKPAQS